LRIAEDLATVDLLAGARINPGLSMGEPMHYDTVKHELHPNSSELEDSGYARVDRLARDSLPHPVTSATPTVTKQVTPVSGAVALENVSFSAGRGMRCGPAARREGTCPQTHRIFASGRGLWMFAPTATGPRRSNPRGQAPRVLGNLPRLATAFAGQLASGLWRSAPLRLKSATDLVFQHRPHTS
jgi:hypothetical protein